MEAKTIKLEKDYIMQTYSRFPIIVEKGKGCYIYDDKDKEYLDLLGGIATCLIGHSNKAVSKALSSQAEKLINITNLYYTEEQAVLAEKLSKLSKMGKCFFCNSGTEANEAAIKLARKITGKDKIIATEQGFHGRTFGALAATWKQQYKTPFMPLVPGFEHVPYDDADAIEKAIDAKTAAVMIEPIQGEAGVIIPKDDYLKKVSDICKKNNVLLIVDEVQSGCGRTGKFLACHHSGIEPDIITLAKGIGNGVPIGVCIAKKGLDFEKGNHASTFGGNSLCCAAANATMDYVVDNKLMDNAKNIGKYFIEKLEELKEKKKIIKIVRGKGLMIAVELNEEKAKEITNKALENGLIINNANDITLRFLPALIITKKEVDKAIEILEKVL